MAAKPADFFIGVVDFFAIILPGALLSYLALEAATQETVYSMMPALRGTAQGWVAFTLSSYLLGHFASLIGARFLDPLYEKTFMGRWKRAGDRPFELAGERKDKALGTKGTESVTN
jgi:hypothetical protein